MGLCHSTIKTRTGLNMYAKPEQSYALNYLYPVLNAAAQSIQTIAGTWDTCSVSQKAEILEATEQLTELVTEVMAASLALEKQTTSNDNENN